jgi:hypothetical protein
MEPIMRRNIPALLLLSAAFAATGYHRVQKISIGGDGGWDYLIADGASGRVYVSHGAEVDVVDTKTSQVIGKIAEWLASRERGERWSPAHSACWHSHDRRRLLGQHPEQRVTVPGAVVANAV